ncbi:MAG: metallophosphoesterase family protein, partial [Clostridia bacterium]|nr:metallophosphoesterase family protein [Clostridia bacterium]
MLRFLVFSDTHGVREPMQELYNLYPNDGIIHLGDYIADARWMLSRTAGHPVYQVKGNCDYGA